MAIDPESVGTAAGSGGIIAAVIAYFHREKITDMKNEIDDLRKSTISVSQCQPCQSVAEAYRKEIREDIKEIKDDIKMLIKHSLQRREIDA